LTIALDDPIYTGRLLFQNGWLEGGWRDGDLRKEKNLKEKRGEQKRKKEGKRDVRKMKKDEENCVTK